MVSVCENLYPGYRFFAYDNYKLFKGLVFDDSMPDSVALDVAETAADGSSITLNVKIWSTNPKGFRVNHYAADITLLTAVPVRPTYAGFNQTESALADSMVQPYSNGTLFHGASFQNIQRVINVGDTKLTMACVAPTVNIDAQGQFVARSTNPYVDDVLYQAMLVWVRNSVGKGSLPTSAARCEQYEVIPGGTAYFVSLDVISSQPSKLVADITLHDEDGRVYTKMLKAEVTISDALGALFLENTPAAKASSKNSKVKA